MSKRKEIPYEQPQRRAGKTHNNWYSLYDAAMLSFTSYTRVGLRIATFFGFAVAGVSFLIALLYFVYKLLHWGDFSAGTAPLLIVRSELIFSPGASTLWGFMYSK